MKNNRRDPPGFSLFFLCSFLILSGVNLVAQSFVFALSREITGKVVAIADGDTLTI